MPSLPPAATRVERSGIREIVNLAFGRPDIARLEVGEPGRPTPAHIVEAAFDATTRWSGYTPSAGSAELREAIADDLVQRYGAGSASADRVIVGQGAGQALSAIFSTLLAPGDEVLIPDPAWPNYRMLALLHGAVPVAYPATAATGFVPDPDDVAARCTPRTKLLVLNSPSNPTGALLPAAVLARLIDVAAARGIVVVSDEVYDQVIFDGEPAAAATSGYDGVVSVFSFSKTYAMTGWRVGYALAPTWLASTLGHAQEPLLSCISSVSQAAALAALRGPQDAVASMRAEYERNRDVALGLLAASGIEAVRPDGAFYLMVPLGAGVDSRRAAIDLVDHGVATAPGTAFGTAAADQLRISLASDEAVLRTGLERLLDWYGRTEAGTRTSTTSVTA